MNNERWITTAELQRQLGVNHQTIFRWIKRDNAPHSLDVTTQRKRYLIPVNMFNQWLERHRFVNVGEPKSNAVPPAGWGYQEDQMKKQTNTQDNVGLFGDMEPQAENEHPDVPAIKNIAAVTPMPEPEPVPEPKPEPVIELPAPRLPPPDSKCGIAYAALVKYGRRGATAYEIATDIGADLCPTTNYLMMLVRNQSWSCAIKSGMKRTVGMREDMDVYIAKVCLE